MAKTVFPSVEAFLSAAKPFLAKGPVALIFAEDASALEPTITHHANAGFAQVVVFLGRDVPLPEANAICVQTEGYDTAGMVRIVTRVNRLAPEGTWLYYCFNAEFLFYPFCEHRDISEMLAFHSEERRDAMLTYVADLYAVDLDAHPDAVDLEAAHLDKSGYYALPRADDGPDGHPKDRQLDFYGGLRWRFEEHVPKARRRIDRISLFRARADLELRPDFTFSDEEYNTYACPWHHNLTATICSFRSAKALKRNPGSRDSITSFNWHNSERFRWNSQQLLDLGLMEPGQWF